MPAKKFILWFDEIGINDVALVGGKNASLGEMYTNLSKHKIKIPYGFAITAKAYKYLIEKSGVVKEINRILRSINVKNVEELSAKGKEIRELIRHCKIPDDLENEIREAYRALCRFYRQKNADVAVRSSATAEDLPEASFAAQQETYLNISGEESLLEACKKCFASLFTNRAISYRVDKGFDHSKVYLSIGVQKMIRSDKACSGVMFTLDTETGFKDVVFITASYGLGENIVKGAVNPDEFHVFKPALMQGYKPIISKNLGDKAVKMIYSDEGEKSTTKNVNVSFEERRKFCLTDEEVLKLSKWGCIVEEYYSAMKRKWTPMDVEWAKDGESNELFIVQARPETVQSQKKAHVIEEYALRKKGVVLAVGKSVGSRIGQGKANIIKDVKDIRKFRKGEVLITDMTDPDWEPIMKIASAIVTNKGGRACHSAIISRELGLPCVVGTHNATSAVTHGQNVTVSCAEGEEGKVYDGLLPFRINRIDIRNIPKTRTKIMMNVGNPEEAFELSFIPNKGIGLAREEFIISSYIRVHPKALIDYPKLPEKVKREIALVTEGYKDKAQFFVDKLAEGIGTIAAAFYPNDVIVRTSDFKSNEYANLIGGNLYEPKEENPMLGWRGASRYYSEEYNDAFALECQAFKKVREEMGLKNVIVMIPFCRTPEEGKKVLGVMAKNGLKKGRGGLKIYAMCEIPSNVLQAEEFLEIFDGFSIGTNDLTQTTLGVDRDSELVSAVYDERNEAVKKLVKEVIKICNKKGKYIGICGDAPSTFMDFTEFLVKSGIKSMSLSHDAVIKTILAVAKMEKRLRR